MSFNFGKGVFAAGNIPVMSWHFSSAIVFDFNQLYLQQQGLAIMLRLLMARLWTCQWLPANCLEVQVANAYMNHGLMWLA